MTQKGRKIKKVKTIVANNNPKKKDFSIILVCIIGIIAKTLPRTKEARMWGCDNIKIC